MPKAASKKKTNSKEVVHYFFSSIFVIFILFLSFANLEVRQLNNQILGAKIDYSEIEKEKAYWEDLVSRHPSYKDGWLELAKIAAFLGETDYAQGALNTAFQIDPNSKETERVKRDLGF